MFESDQMQSVNSIMVLLLIPVFEKFVYPALKYFKLPLTPLQRMGTGATHTMHAFRIDVLRDAVLRAGLCRVCDPAAAHRPGVHGAVQPERHTVTSVCLTVLVARHTTRSAP